MSAPIILILFLFLSACESRGPTVSTASGKILGHHKTSFGKKTFSAFEGIPFAKPPIGDRRFKEPEPIESWYGTWDASHLSICAQVQILSELMKISGDEDCLYLNVYVPRDQPEPSEKLDVIVHIHGGGFMFGSGHDYAFPEYLMDENVIFVTFNYRLGIFGFLSTEDQVLPGNNGLKDQVLALKWVKENIANFGGNRDSITITGASAGGASVHLQYFSPMSKGLFHRGLSQSGSALNPWVISRGALGRAKILALSLGCPDDPSDVLLKCIKQRTSHQILSKIRLFHGYSSFPTVTFGPVVEKGTSGAFLNREPFQMLVNQEVSDLPWIASVVPHEGGSMISGLKGIQDINTPWKDFAPFVLSYNYTVPKGRRGEVADKIKQFYMGSDQNFTEENHDRFIKIVTDRLIVNGVVKAVDLQAKSSNSPVYLYEMSYTGDSKRVVEHADDNQYFYYDKFRQPTENELRVKDVLVNILVSYAKTGKPTISGIDWKSVKPDQFNFLNISGSKVENIKSQTGRVLGNVDFWNSLDLLEDESLVNPK